MDECKPLITGGGGAPGAAYATAAAVSYSSVDEINAAVHDWVGRCR